MTVMIEIDDPIIFVPRSRLLVHCAPTVAARFHKRHLATFLGNPEFKLFIQQLAEVSLSSRK